MTSQTTYEINESTTREPMHVANVGSPASKRISWAAIFAGVVIVLVVQLTLNTLGLGIGAGTVDPLSEEHPMNGIALGAGVWFVVTLLIALFAGGYVAGRLAGVPRRVDGILHGTLVWGLAMLATGYLLTTALGGAIGGAAGVLGKGLSLAGSGVAAAAPAVSKKVGSALDNQGVSLDTGPLRSQLETLLRQTGKPELQPAALTGIAKNADADAKATATQAAVAPQASDDEVRGLVDRIMKGADGPMQAVDRDALVNVVAARSGKSHDEAGQIVANYDKTYQEAQAKYKELKDTAALKARQAGDQVAEGVSKAALWTFFALILSALAAAFGGNVGTPQETLPTLPVARLA